MRELHEILAVDDLLLVGFNLIVLTTNLLVGDVLTALVSISRNTGDFRTALRHARELGALYPADTRLRALVSDLEKRQAR
jgi:hypothetical protein